MDPKRCKRRSFRTIKITSKSKAVICRPKGKTTRAQAILIGKRESPAVKGRLETSVKCARLRAAGGSCFWCHLWHTCKRRA